MEPCFLGGGRQAATRRWRFGRAGARRRCHTRRLRGVRVSLGKTKFAEVPKKVWGRSTSFGAQNKWTVFVVLIWLPQNVHLARQRWKVRSGASFGQKSLGSCRQPIAARTPDPAEGPEWPVRPKA